MKLRLDQAAQRIRPFRYRARDARFMRKQHPTRFISILCAAASLTGCSSISTKSVAAKWSSPPPPLYFGGVRNDYHGIVDARQNESPAFWVIYSAIDMPFSACGDILLIPYDVYTDCRWRHQTDGTAAIAP